MALREKRNKIAENKGLGPDGVRVDAKALRQRINTLEAEIDTITASVTEEAMLLPNITHPEVPVGPEKNAKVVRVIGEKLQLAGPVADHAAIGTWRDRGTRQRWMMLNEVCCMGN